MNWKNEVKNFVNNEIIFSNLEKYVDIILEYNQVMNLTGFDNETIWIDGIYQSIYLLNKNIDNHINEFKLLDIGAGAGFPSIPYLIYKNNDFELTIIESNKKRIDFLEYVKTKLDLNIILINKRIEETKIEENFDFITARAVTSLKNLIEISSKVGKINSKYFFLKSQNYQNELNDAKSIINKLRINNIEIKKYDINDNKQHYCISYIKTCKTPNEFPRKWSLINKKK